ncbi:MAG TPA: hypothetical protein VJT33_11845 [bacterium]|nr:hypothetical protein [bacterium]
MNNRTGGLDAVRLYLRKRRVKAALAKIYETTQHANHDIADAADWGIVEGEAQAALNIAHEAERRP